MKSRTEKHVTELKRDYEAIVFHSDHINFQDAENQTTIHVVDAGFVYGACAKIYSILAINLKKNGYGICGDLKGHYQCRTYLQCHRLYHRSGLLISKTVSVCEKKAWPKALHDLHISS